MPTENYNNKNRSKKEYLKKRNIKEYRRISKNGIIVMVIVMAIFALFANNPSGYTLYERISGKATKMVHSSLTIEQASDIKVLIDPGHGGFDNGATTKYVDKTESELNLMVSQKLKEELEGVGFQVEMTRTDSEALGNTKNSDMAKRKAMIFESDADIIVSIHMNTHQDKSVNGPIVFYMPGSSKGNELASLVQASMNNELNPKSPKSPQAQNFLVLRSGNMPGILIECGFISNKDEAYKLGKESYQKKMVQSISWGIMDYFAKRA